MEGNMKQWALHYAGMGMAVFPIKPRSKQPLTGKLVEPLAYGKHWNSHRSRFGWACGD